MMAGLLLKTLNEVSDPPISLGAPELGKVQAAALLLAKLGWVLLQ